MTALLPWYWRWVVLAILLASVAGFSAFRMHVHDQIKYQKLQGEYAGFQAKVAAEGKVAQRDADARVAAEILKQEKADANHKNDVDTLQRTISKLRKSRTGGDFVPPAPSCPGIPDSACFNRPILERAIRSFDEGLSGLVDEGSKAQVDLNSAKEWATGLTLKLSDRIRP